MELNIFLRETIKRQVESRAERRGVKLGSVEPGTWRKIRASDLQEEVHEVRCFERVKRWDEQQSLLLCAIVLLIGEKAGLGHLRKDPELPFEGAIKVRNGIQARGCLGKTGQQSAFGGGKVAQRFAEIKLRRVGAAIVEIAIFKAVQVLAKNALFVPDLFEAHGLERLDYFRAERARPRLGQLDELLGNCRTAGDYAAMGDELAGGTKCRSPVHTVVLAETAVFGAKCSLDQVLGNFTVSNPLLKGGGTGSRGAQGDAVAIQDLELRHFSSKQWRWQWYKRKRQAEAEHEEQSGKQNCEFTTMLSDA